MNVFLSIIYLICWTPIFIGMFVLLYLSWSGVFAGGEDAVICLIPAIGFTVWFGSMIGRGFFK